ncbi:MAG TPA: hypothetical protein DEQ80_08460 [Anaerolinea thermolimosa]|uniref:histidine kinase n=1 Tax=Anaerolinea thermolimosa TaxID=229919 RepID=A0A3D1JJS9_9CHLR|nr:response regulator [Anaerolinea thermolimosa]GAP06280.1 histidine kinase [Anaerolinea thermolimosa]HCE17876.1 hypothetical protein [Anaerolinea thermolimosa]
MPGASVLIVDDDRSIVRLCQRLLERASYSVLASTDPIEALKILNETKVDLLLADIRMPVMDGFELIERARQIYPDLAVLVMTGFGTVDTAVQALYKGVDGLILKPFENTADLVQAVQRVMLDRKQKEEAARAQALRPLFDISETLLSETNPRVLETLVPDTLMETFQAHHVGVFHSSQAGQEGQLLISRNIPDPVATPAWAGLVRFAQECQAETAVNIQEESDPVVQNHLRSLGWSSMMVAPVLRNQQRYLFIVARNMHTPVFRESELELLTILARQSVVAMENARLYTDLKEYVRKVEESQRALVQAEKMAAVGRLMASMAHEINNPLQSVRNCLHLAMREDISDNQRSNYLSMTVTEVERLVNAVRHMLDFYRPGTTEKEMVNLNGVIERVAHLLQAQLISANIDLELSLPDEPILLFGVKDQLQQVVFNLLLNGMDAVENQMTKKIWVELSKQGEDITLTIEDSGRGIPAEVQNRLFEPFISTKSHGTGLGLSISYTIVEAHGGQLALVPGRHGEGACFAVQLPVQPKEGSYGKDPGR